MVKKYEILLICAHPTFDFAKKVVENKRLLGLVAVNNHRRKTWTFNITLFQKTSSMILVTHFFVPLEFMKFFHLNL